MDSQPCEFCGNDVPLAKERCPHCALPGLFPNVRAAGQDAERQALELRYHTAVAAAGAQGATRVLKDFEAALSRSKAVMARPLWDLDRLASSDLQLYKTFYELLEAEVRLPYGDKWDNLRGLADRALFPGYEQHIRFGVLSLDGAGLPTYGDASFVLREDMIAHRASVYEGNSTLLAEKHGYKDQPGFRAVWGERTKLCVAKLAAEVEASTPPEQFTTLLLRQGAAPEEDRFVEVHLWGPMSIRTVEKVVITAPGRTQAFRKALRDRVRRWGVKVEDRA